MTEGRPDLRPRGSQEPLDTAYDVALLDLDGVVYLGGTAIPGAAEALRKADAAGMRLAYVTNNAFRTPAAIAAAVATASATVRPVSSRRSSHEPPASLPGRRRRVRFAWRCLRRSSARRSNSS